MDGCAVPLYGLGRTKCLIGWRDAGNLDVGVGGLEERRGLCACGIISLLKALTWLVISAGFARNIPILVRVCDSCCKVKCFKHFESMNTWGSSACCCWPPDSSHLWASLPHNSFELQSILHK